LKITHPAQSGNQVCIVICIGHATYRFGISQKRSGGVVSSEPRNCRFGVPSHFQSCLSLTNSGQYVLLASLTHFYETLHRVPKVIGGKDT